MSSTLTTFFAGLHDRVTEHRREKLRNERTTAPSFSVFRYVRPDENQLSDILADLLNPHGTHGQGALFVRRFIEHAGIAFDIRPEDFERTRVRREAPTTQLLNNRRIDLTLEVGKFAVAIENKPWAADQPDQLVDYDRHLRARYGAGNYILLYMPGTYQLPPSLSEDDRRRLESEGQFKTFPLNTAVAAWLVACRQDCVAENVCAFLGDFTNYLKSAFGGWQMQDEAEKRLFVEHALLTPANLDIALSFLAHADGIRAGIRDTILRPFVDEIMQCVVGILASRDKGWELGLGHAGVDSGWVHLSRSTWPDHADTKRGLRVVLTSDFNFRMYFQIRQGVYPAGGAVSSDPLAERLVAAAKLACGKGQVSQHWWPGWYKPAEKFCDWSDPEVLLALSRNQGEAVKYFAEQLVRLAVAVDAALQDDGNAVAAVGATR